MHHFTISSNDYLRKDIQAFYHTDYVGHKKTENPNYINILKNTYNKCSTSDLTKLNRAAEDLRDVLVEDLPQILQLLSLKTLTLCVVPRAKAETTYTPNQLFFKSTISEVVKQLNGFSDGTNYIIRHTNTKTTHLPPNTPNYNNDGVSPYPRITVETCNISSDVKDRDILLIDDVYTKKVNIDEDAIQALLDKGAHSVTFYAVGRTKEKTYDLFG